MEGPDVRRSQTGETAEPPYLGTYRRHALYVCGEDVQIGLNLTFHRVFAIPEIANLLDHTGRIAAQPLKRTYDTGIIILELVTHGLDSSRGRALIRMINRAHRPFQISDEDYLYVLCAFIVAPFKWVDKRSRRRPPSSDREAATEFYAALGRRIGVKSPPATYEEAAKYLIGYEREHAGYTRSAQNLTAATLPVLASQLPGFLRSRTSQVLAAMFDDCLISDSLGLPQPSWWVRAALAGNYSVRNFRTRKQPVRTDPAFDSGAPIPAVYPGGYELADLG